MIVIPTDHSAYSLKMSGLESRIIGKRLLAISHSVRLDVGLIDDIQSITVAKRIPERVIRIVAGTYGIDVQLLHDLYITYHICFRHHISLVRVHLMTVDTLDKDRLSVDLELAVFDADIPETHFQSCLLSLSLLVIGSQRQSIEPRSLGCPLLHLRDGTDICNDIVTALGTFHLRCCRFISDLNLTAVRIIDIEGHRSDSLLRFNLDLCLA